MADLTYNDYLLHKVVQSYSLRGQSWESSRLEKNVSLYLNRQAGKVRSQIGNVNSHELINQQKVQPPFTFNEYQIQRLQQQHELATSRNSIHQAQMTFGIQNEYEKQEKDKFIIDIKKRIHADEYVDDFFVLTDGVKSQRQSQQKDERQSIEKQMKTVLQDQMNEDTLKKLHRKFTLETLKKNLTLYNRQQMFAKEHEMQSGSLKIIQNKNNNNNNNINNNKSVGNPKNARFSKAASMSCFSSQIQTPRQIIPLLNTVSPKEQLLDEVQEKLQTANQIESEEFLNMDKDKDDATMNSKTSKLSILSYSKDRMKKSRPTSIERKPVLNNDIQISDEIQEIQNENDNQPLFGSNLKLQTRENLTVEQLTARQKEKMETQILKLAKIKEINKKTRSFKVNNEKSEKQHIMNICKHFDLNIPKLFHLDEKQRLGEIQLKQLSEVSLHSAEEDEKEGLGIFDEDLQDSDEEEVKQKKKGNRSSNQSKISQYRYNSLGRRINDLTDREDKVLFERLRFSNEQVAVDEQDVKLIKSIENLENKQFLYQKHIEKKKRLMMLESLKEKERIRSMHHQQSLMNLLSPSMIKSNQNNSISSLISASPMISPRRIISPIPSMTQITATATKSPSPQRKLDNSAPKLTNRLQPMSPKSSQIPPFEYSISHKKPIEKKVTQRQQRLWKAPFLNSKNDLESEQKAKCDIQIKPLNIEQLNQTNNEKKIEITTPKANNRLQLSFLSSPKFSNTSMFKKQLKNQGFESARDSLENPQKNSLTAAIPIINSNNNSSIQFQKRDSLIERLHQAKDLKRIKDDFAEFYQICSAEGSQAQASIAMQTERASDLRESLSAWYCSHQAELNELSSKTNLKQSSLSPEFKIFIEQKNFKKKLFNYLINSMDPRDRQLAIYFFKQEQELDEMSGTTTKVPLNI